MDLEGASRFGAPLLLQSRPEGADQRLDAGVDVGAIEGGEAGVEGGLEGVEGRCLLDRPVAAGELPVAADHARDRVAGAEFGLLDHRGPQSGSGTAVVAAWLKRRVPMRLMRNRLPQFGSGQATSASLVIQSLAWLGRCLAARSGSTAASE